MVCVGFYFSCMCVYVVVLVYINMYVYMCRVVLIGVFRLLIYICLYITCMYIYTGGDPSEH